MTHAERARALGIDPDDPKYHDRHPATTGELCDWCHRHPAAAPRLLCDVQREASKVLRAHGEPHEPCFRCRNPRCETRGLLCEECEAAIERIATPKSWFRGNGKRGIYRPDGAGCVERVHPTEAAWESRVMGGLPDGWFE